MKSKRGLGMLSFISLIVGLVFICVFIFTGNFLITMAFGYILLALSFVLSLFSRNDKFGRVSLYAFPLIATIYLLFFGVMYLFWNTP
ncbi:hypothetical protein DVB69_09455 [Sporosarcina sp. BI001-red]|uniref:hypothetical protein n=1 Tax=Sporosarcina sp. BI001-red TaxID=2282866 RepID=UPI000E25C8DA|nr:hypothetical protein [Sporosarcina sp. BI001-red]REB07075.1 hypothetical protein DVB69_09455 [Sporosarcina sp. BI001-red]